MAHEESTGTSPQGLLSPLRPNTRKVIHIKQNSYKNGIVIEKAHCNAQRKPTLYVSNYLLACLLELGFSQKHGC